jgi:hypothetical protein
MPHPKIHPMVNKNNYELNKITFRREILSHPDLYHS